MRGTAALITLRDGKTYAASSYETRDGHVRAVCRRFVRVGPQGGERTSFHGPLAERSWPRDAVRDVKAVEPWGERSEGASAAVCAS